MERIVDLTAHGLQHAPPAPRKDEAPTARWQPRLDSIEALGPRCDVAQKEVVFHVDAGRLDVHCLWDGRERRPAVAPLAAPSLITKVAVQRLECCRELDRFSGLCGLSGYSPMPPAPSVPRIS